MSKSHHREELTAHKHMALGFVAGILLLGLLLASA
jgi:hypothetical protein